MSSRAYASANVSLGLVQVPVECYKASTVTGMRDKLYVVCPDDGERPKQRIDCPKCAKSWTSWQGIPTRAFDAGAGVIVTLTTKEIDEAKSGAKHDSLAIEKAVPVGRLMGAYVLADPTYFLPPKDAPASVLELYRTIVVVLAEDGRALVGRLTLRNNTKRLAVMADAAKNVLVAYTVLDAEAVPRAVPVAAPNPALVAQAKMILASSVTDDPTIEAEADPVEGLLSKKLEALIAGALSASTPAVAKAA